MVQCDVQRWNMQKQIDATRYIVPYKSDDRMSIIVLRYARRRMRIVSQSRLTLWRHSALRCDVTPRYAFTWLFTRKTPSYKTYTCKNLINNYTSFIFVTLSLSTPSRECQPTSVPEPSPWASFSATYLITHKQLSNMCRKLQRMYCSQGFKAAIGHNPS